MKKMVIGLISGLALLATSPATAQSICGPHEELVQKLGKDFKEARAGLGLAGNGGLVELYVSEKGSWSMVITRPGGVSCLVAAGDNWEIVKPDFFKVSGEVS